MPSEKVFRHQKNETNQPRKVFGAVANGQCKHFLGQIIINLWIVRLESRMPWGMAEERNRCTCSKSSKIMILQKWQFATNQTRNLVKPAIIGSHLIFGGFSQKIIWQMIQAASRDYLESCG